ncbi:MAG: hypothetical protein ABJB98_04080 [Actinomycetota bacterium]
MDVTDVVELRVHGVSGTPPEELLDRPLVRQVAGDTTAGFYRPRLESERRDTPVDDPDVPGAPLEGYAWGGLTSGAPSRALWLLLLPFTLVNVAPRMRPAGPDDSVRASRLVWSLWYVTRLLAIALTMTLALAFCGVGIDLLGWQCGSASTRCSNASPGWLFDPILRLAPGRQLAVGALVPLLVLGVLSLVSGRTINRYESVLPAVPSDAGDDSAAEVALDSPWMWRGEHLARRLRHLHLQGAVATVLAVASWPLDSWWRGVALMIAAAVVGLIAVLLAVPMVTRRARTERLGNLVIWGTWAALVATAAVTAALLLGDADLRIPSRYATDQDQRGLPGFGDTVLVLFAVDLILVLALAVVVLGLRRRTVRPSPRPGLWGVGTVALAALGVLLAAVFSSGVYLYVAAWLTTGSFKPSFVQIAHVADSFAVPEAIRDGALAYLVSTVIVAVMVAMILAWIGFTLARIRVDSPPMNGHEFGPDYPAKDPASPRGKRVLRTLWVARLADLGGSVIGIVLFPGAVLTVFITALLMTRSLGGPARPADLLTGKASTASSWWFPADGWRSARSLQGAGAYLVVLTLFALILIGAAAFRVRATRRSIGILWDLASFWPRAAHPLAAPCYAERTVPDLITRIRWYTDGPDSSATRGYPAGAVVLAGHSQGTVISAAVLRQLATADAARPDERPVLPHVAYLSFGCVLRRLYARYFPAYFGSPVLDEVAGSLNGSTGPLRWRNLWRHSDYLGGPIASGPSRSDEPATGPISAADRRLVDPTFDRPPGDTVDPAPSRHSDYPDDPIFQLEVSGLAAMLPGRPAEQRPEQSDQPPTAVGSTSPD